MSHESNQNGKIGAQNPNLNAADFKQRGMSDSAAAEAAAAAERARQAQQQKQNG